MPYYEIIMQIKTTSAGIGGQHTDVKEVRVIRNWPSSDIDRLYMVCSGKCRKKWGDKLINFNCQMISKYSSTYNQYLRQRIKKE